MADSVQSDPIALIADVQRVRRAINTPAERHRLARVSRGLRAEVDAGVPKHRAARLLGVSPQALERWVGQGQIPTIRRPGSSRELIDRDALIVLLAQTDTFKEAGASRPLAKAIAALSGSARLAPRPAPNQSAGELRYECEHSTPAGRMRSAVALSQTASVMAARARARQRAQR